MKKLRSRYWLAALVLLAACGGGSGDLAGNVSLVQADWIVVDLASGEASGLSAAPNLADDAYRGQRLVFRALPAGSSASGSPPGTRWGQPDELVGSAGSGRIFLSVFEITRGQWRLLAGTTPWSQVPAGLRGADDDRLPVCGLSLDAANAGCATGTARMRGSFQLPSDAEWEYACRAGASTRFAWGETTDAATVTLHAAVAETTAAPSAVGGRLANAFGFHDMHGSIWELTSAGHLRGGSWRDSLPMARSANFIAIDRTTPGALVGVRLVYKPDDP
jgi:hypothetical protein